MKTNHTWIFLFQLLLSRGKHIPNKSTDRLTDQEPSQNRSKTAGQIFPSNRLFIYSLTGGIFSRTFRSSQEHGDYGYLEM